MKKKQIKYVKHGNRENHTECPHLALRTANTARPSKTAESFYIE